MKDTVTRPAIDYAAMAEALAREAARADVDRGNRTAELIGEVILRTYCATIGAPCDDLRSAWADATDLAAAAAEIERRTSDAIDEAGQ